MEKDDKNVHEGHRARLRERFLMGKETFKEHELLELLLGYSIPRKDTNGTAHALINRFGSLSKVISADPSLLMGVDGIGEKTACLITLVNYINTVSLKSSVRNAEINTLEKTVEILKPLFKDADHEMLFVLLLNSSNKIVDFLKFDNKKTNEVSLKDSEILSAVISNKASSVIIAHNHLTPAPNPSHDDDKTTFNFLVQLGTFKINLLDHVIFGTEDECFSYAQNGKLDIYKRSAGILPERRNNI